MSRTITLDTPSGARADDTGAVRKAPQELAI